MATKNYIISDGYYREEYPMNTNLDTKKFYATERLEQETTIIDMLGDNLAVYLIDTIVPKASASREDWEAAFLAKMQQIMTLFIAKALQDFANPVANDNRVSGLNNKIIFLKKKIRAYIVDTDELVAIQDDDVEPDRNSVNLNPTYFPR